jgi:hypothetical protein
MLNFLTDSVWHYVNANKTATLVDLNKKYIKYIKH